MSDIVTNAFESVISLLFAPTVSKRKATPYFQSSMTLHTPNKDLTSSDEIGRAHV